MVPSNSCSLQTLTPLVVSPSNNSNKFDIPTAPVQTSLQDNKLTKTAAEMGTGETNSLHLSMVCHELRTPLVGIMGNVNILTTSSKGLETAIKACDKIGVDAKARDEFLNILQKQQSILHSIDNCTKYQKGLINDILDIEKIKAGQFKLASDAMNPKKILDTVLNSMVTQVKQKQLKVSVVDQSVFWQQEQIMGNEIRLQQILRNLMQYAVEVTPQNEKIVVSIEEPKIEKENVILTMNIETSGLRLSKTSLEAFTNPNLTDIEQLNTKKMLGVGFSKTLAMLMGGDLNISSQSTNEQGNKFTVQLPCKMVQNSAKATSPLIFTQPSKANTNGKHILVVDDHEVNRKLAKRELERVGYQCSVVKDGAEAVAFFIQHKPYAILMDLNMPVMGGIEATRRIRELEKKNELKLVPIFAMSASDSETLSDELLKVGMNECLGKPFKAETLFKLLKKYEEDPVAMVPFILSSAESIAITGSQSNPPSPVLVAQTSMQVGSESTTLMKKPSNPNFQLGFVCDQIRSPLQEIAEYLKALSSTNQALEAHSLALCTDKISSDIKLQVLNFIQLQKSTLRILEECEKHQATLINDIEDFSLLKIGQLKLKNTIIEPNKIVTQALEILNPQIAIKNLRIAITNESLYFDKPVLGDKDRLRQVILNLLSNAIKFTPQNGTIKFVLHEPVDTINGYNFKFSVEDTGIGMSGSELQNLFKPYHQANVHIQTEFGGTGLGLWISKLLVTLMGGEIKAESLKDSGGKGSKFTFNIKCTKCVQTENLSQQPAKPIILSNFVRPSSQVNPEYNKNVASIVNQP